MFQDTCLQHLKAIELPTPFPVGPITVYLADAPGEPLTLIDTGPHTPEARATLAARLADRGYGLADLDRVVITHAHVDHFGLAAEMAEAARAKVLTHPWNVAALADYGADRDRRLAFYADLLRRSAVPTEITIALNQATRGVNLFARPVAVDATLDEGDLLRFAGRDWQVLHTPGHAAGLICLYEPRSRTLLSSDHLLANVSSNPVIEPPPPGRAERLRSLALYTASLQRVANMGIDTALPSHGPVIRNVVGLVRQRLAFHQQRMDRVLKALQAGAKTTWEVTYALFPERTPLDTFLAVSEVIGHLDLLELEGNIVGEDTGDGLVWQLAEPVT
jgi:glyoxylase-like metal-dependent hydrolase (beta-lactamase superfamily II)